MREGKKEFAMLQKVWRVEAGEQAEIEKENPKQRQMDPLGSDFAAGEGRKQVPGQTSL